MTNVSLVLIKVTRKSGYMVRQNQTVKFRYYQNANADADVGLKPGVIFFKSRVLLVKGIRHYTIRFH